MSEKQIHISVKGKIATVSEMDFELVGGNSDYKVVFDFDEDWDKHEVKTALFVYGNTPVEKVFSGNVCEGVAVYGATMLLIGVYSGDIATTTPACISGIRQSIKDVAENAHESPTEDVYNQLIEMINSGQIKGENGKSAYEIAVENGYEGTEEEWLDYLAASPSQMQPHKKGVFARNLDASCWYTIAKTGASRIPRIGLFKVLVKDNSSNWEEIFFVARQCFNSGDVTILSHNQYGKTLITDIGIYNINGSGITELSIRVNVSPHATKNLEIVVLMLESKFDVDGINKWKLEDIKKSSVQNTDGYTIFSLLEIGDWVNEKLRPMNYDITVLKKDITTLKSKTTNLENSIGDIDTALDTLHTYAQNLVNGGNA